MPIMVLARPGWHVDDCTALVLLTQKLQKLVPVYQCQEGQNDSQGKL